LTQCSIEDILLSIEIYGVFSVKKGDKMKRIFFLIIVIFVIKLTVVQAQDNDSSPIESGNKNYSYGGFAPAGLYIETTIPPFITQLFKGAPFPFNGGATYMDFGLGVTFFNDNIKLQGNYGFLFQKQYESMGGVGDVNYGGHVFGLKILGGYTFHFGRFFGTNLDWLAASLSIGANFSLFNTTINNYDDYVHDYVSGRLLKALIIQLEFPRITIFNHKYFRAFSLFTEYQSWYLSSLSLGYVISPHLIMGLRMYIF
jgi:hypothetical protein